MLRYILLLFISGFVILFGSSCKSDIQHQADAVERARSYLLKNSPEMGFEERKFVQYNPPVFLTAPLIGETPEAKEYTFALEKMQICVTWSVPGEKDAYLVYGAGRRSMVDWTPERILRKNLSQEKSPILTAYENARRYALNNIHTMDVSMFNFVRFANPKMAITKLVPIGDEALDEIKLIAGNQAKRKISSADDVVFQITLYWEAEGESAKNASSIIAVSGYSKGTLQGWKPLFGGYYSPEEFAKIIRVNLDDSVARDAYMEQLNQKLNAAQNQDVNSIPAKSE